MAYIGKKPIAGNFQMCDAISVVNGQAAYTMQVGGVNVAPETALNTIVSLNGTIQKANSSYTIANSVITFSSNLATGDVIDFILILGDVLSIGTPSDGTVATAKLSNDAVTSAKTNFFNADTSAADLGTGLHIKTGDSSVSSLSVSHDELVVESDGNVGISIIGGTSSTMGVAFGDSGDSDIGRINYVHSDNSMRLINNATENVRIHSNGVMAANAGIALGVGTANTASNVLDDYEEGTFTPDTNIGFSSAVGEYVKIGKMVHFAIQATFNAGPGDGSQASSITGLPFSASPGDQLAEIWVVTHNEHVIGQVGGTGIALKGRGDGINITRGQIGSKGFQATGTYHIDL